MLDYSIEGVGLVTHQNGLNFTENKPAKEMIFDPVEKKYVST